MLDCISHIRHNFKEIFKFNILLHGLFCVISDQDLPVFRCACFPSLTLTALCLCAYGLRKTSFDCAHTHILWAGELPTLSNVCNACPTVWDFILISNVWFERSLSDKTTTSIYKTKQNQYICILNSPLNQNPHILCVHGILQCLF